MSLAARPLTLALSPEYSGEGTALRCASLQILIRHSSRFAQFHEPLSRFAADELSNAAVGIVFEFAGRSVEDDLRFIGAEPGEGVEHDDTISHFARRPHVVRDDQAGDLVLPAGARLSGSIAVFRGTLRVAGEVEGRVGLAEMILYHR